MPVSKRERVMIDLTLVQRSQVSPEALFEDRGGLHSDHPCFELVHFFDVAGKGKEEIREAIEI